MRKTVFKYFTVMQYSKEEAFLRSMHRAGWRLEGVTGFCRYHFVSCEPEDVVYRLDYNKDGVMHKPEYVQLFGDCGWEYIQDYLGYSYFRKPACDDIQNNDIFCDDESRFQLIERIARGRIAPLLTLFFAVAIQFFLSLQYHRPIFAMICAGILVMYAAILGCFALQYLKFRNHIG